MNKSNTYKPYKELILNSRTNKLNSIIQNDINKKDYDSIKEMLEEKQEIIIKIMILKQKRFCHPKHQTKRNIKHNSSNLVYFFNG